MHRDSDIWKYIGEVLLPQLYPIKWFNDINPKFQDDPDVRDFPGKLFLNDLNTKLLTGARIRQLRSTKGWLCFLNVTQEEEIESYIDFLIKRTSPSFVLITSLHIISQY